MTKQHSQSVALVTGGNRGIGRAVVAGLAARGVAVVLGSRDRRRGAQAAAELRSCTNEIDTIELDVTDPSSIAAATRHLSETFGKLDVLVNNAGIAGHPAGQSPGSIDLPVYQKIFATNVFGAIAVTDAMLPLLRKSPAGRVVNVSSGLGSLVRMSDPGDYFAKLPPLAAYAPSKTALNSVTVQYAKALRDDGILVNAADPGPCATDFTAGMPGITRTAADGAAVIIRLATLDADGPSGGYFNDTGPVPW